MNDDDKPCPWRLRLTVWQKEYCLVALIALSLSGWIAVLWGVM